MQHAFLNAVAFFQGLDHVQAIVLAVSGEQFFVGSILGDAAVHQDHDAVCSTHRREPMGDHHGGTVGHEIFQRVLHETLRIGVKER